MGYTTNFCGSFVFSRDLTEQEIAFINAFANTRRMRRDVAKLQAEFEGKHGNPFTPENPYGPEGAYFASEDNTTNYNHSSILDHNSPPREQPGIWCQWIVKNMQLCWNGSEEFDNYVEWLQYLLDHFFVPWGVKLNGAVQWEGDYSSDRGVISMRNNRIHVHYEDDSDSDEDV